MRGGKVLKNEKITVKGDYPMKRSTTHMNRYIQMVAYP